MNTRDVFSRAKPYWRVYVVAILGGLIAYLGSYAISPTYTSTTRVLLRGRETTLLSSTGQNLSGQPGVIDSTLATALGETQSAVVSSTAVSEAVVDKLHLDAPKATDDGVVSKIKGGVAGTIKRTKAYLTHGFYAEPSTRDAAVTEVQGGLTATPLKDSYVLELTGSADTAQGAADVTNTAADVLVAMSAARYQDEANRNRDFLGEQVKRTETEVNDAAAAKRNYEEQNGVTSVQSSLDDSSASRTKVEDDLRAAGVDLSGLQAQLDTVNAQLAATSPTIDGASKIVTGRSDTSIVTTQQNATYESLQVDKNRLEGAIAGAKARQQTLQGVLAGDPNSALSAQAAGVEQLDQRLTAAQKTYQDVNTQYQNAVLTAQHNNIEITRIDTAQVPTFPVSPVRYNYLFLGLLCGALAGAGLTWLRHRGEAVDAEGAEPSVAGGSDRRSYDPDPYTDPTQQETLDITTPVTVGVGAGVGHGAGNGGGNGGGTNGGEATPARTKVGRFEIFGPDPADSP